VAAGGFAIQSVMTSVEQPPRRKGGPPRAGILILAFVLLTAVILFAALRPPRHTDGNAPAMGSPASGVTPAPVVPADGPPAPASNAPTPNGPTASAGAPGSAALPGQPAAPDAPPVNPSDLPPDHPPIVSDEKTQVSIQWLGHSCFYIFSPGGTAVVTDPFAAKATGLSAPNTGAHLVTVSADSPLHNDPEAVHAFSGDTRQVIRGTEARRGDVRIIPVPTYRDGTGGGREGRNSAYVIEAGAMRIAHLGDIGHTLNAAQLKALGAIDILMLPVGGDGLGPKEAVEVSRQVNPRIVIPMAYSTPAMDGPDARLRPVEEFIAASPYAVTAKDTDIMLISKPDLPAGTEIYTLRYGR
jgi:L-ascorbate metabolism protein UlaG (beta-lactamase superfamily)